MIYSLIQASFSLLKTASVVYVLWFAWFNMSMIADYIRPLIEALN